MGAASANARVELTAGQTAPEFSLPDQTGKVHTLSAYRGQWVLIYFYPKDDTPGCTTEACGLRDRFSAFTKIKAVVLGVSADSVKSHQKFAEKFTLPFPLLADEQKSVVQAYGVWGEKSFMGKKYLGISRMSFLIDPQGRIAKVYPKVAPADHPDEVLQDLEALAR
ncbi:MAG: thiol peroxidase [Omnitrophica WOR_2 bacterium RIFCSPHIGHO2_02_FULL_68_15]|nr:MAG: thiol peroxidase [Omnitrophica WOR_2 bacterium RIFCSPHIGHO2_02_FULL_68_15]